MRLIRQVLKALPTEFREFDAAAETALRRTIGAQDVLVSTLRQRASNFIAAPREMAFMYPIETAAFVEQYRERRRLIDVWEESAFRRPIFVYDLHAYDLLRRVDPEAYLDILESLPHPELARQIVDAANRVASAGDLCALLRQAGPAFDDDGKWIEESKVPFLLLAACTERLSGMANSSAGGGQNGDAQSSDKKIDDMMAEILGALEARADGVVLGYAWVHYLIWSGHARGRWRPRTGSVGAPPAALLTVLTRLGAWLPLHAEPEKWVADEEYVWRNDRIYSLLAVAVSHQPVDGRGLGDLIASLATQDLASTVGIERLATDAGSHERANRRGRGGRNSRSGEMVQRAVGEDLSPARSRPAVSSPARRGSAECRAGRRLLGFVRAGTAQSQFRVRAPPLGRTRAGRSREQPDRRFSAPRRSMVPGRTLACCVLAENLSGRSAGRKRRLP